ncbi:Type II secretory pathway, component PulF [Pseudovibrio denitrificans]|uniref:Type II secretory pathway, component PulF n=1 Tax=Pseudovibrio denitrificans TaxID=258256 RepID=A0A1I7DZS7_9HYPH|nr:type II secretion system F family protein [Pseudovibrio denitrificans]SFU17212.1 Type II secretory pathway, component PulF [Pseudovibrio denitrificans]
MAQFYYQALTATGENKTGHITAESEAEAYAQLRMGNLTPLTLEKESKQSKPARKRATTGNAYLARFFLGMSNLVSSHVPLLDVLEILRESERSRNFKATLEALCQAIQGGHSFSSALRQHPSVFPNYIVKLIEAAEKSGALDVVLKDISDQLESEVATKKRIRSGLTYPLILVCAAIFVIVILTTVLVPAVAPLFVGAGQEVPTIIQILIRAEYFVTSYHFEAAIFVLLMSLFLKLLGSLAPVQYYTAVAFYKIPVIGSFALNVQLSRMLRLVAVMQKNGISLYDALQTAEQVYSSPVIRDLLQACLRILQDGGQLTQVIETRDDLPVLLKRFIVMGERTGTLPDKMQQLSTALHRQTSQQLELFLQVLPPLLTLVIGLLVGSFVVVIMDAILSVNDLAL